MQHPSSYGQSGGHSHGHAPPPQPQQYPGAHPSSLGEEHRSECLRALNTITSVSAMCMRNEHLSSHHVDLLQSSADLLYRTIRKLPAAKSHYSLAHSEGSLHRLRPLAAPSGARSPVEFTFNEYESSSGGYSGHSSFEALAMAQGGDGGSGVRLGMTPGVLGKKRKRLAKSDRQCSICGTSTTPEWRKGPDGQQTLCNACGLSYWKRVRHEKQKLTKEGHEKSAVDSMLQERKPQLLAEMAEQRANRINRNSSKRDKPPSEIDKYCLSFAL